MSTAPLLVEVERSGLVESSHLVDVAVVADDRTPIAWAGEPSTSAYLRSSAKPIQALACLENGWRPSRTDLLAIACASHNGEGGHIEVVRAILEEAGVPEDELRCPRAWPFLPESAAAARDTARIFHNCSGKHAAMLATGRINGWAFEDYRAPNHPMQRAVAGVIERLAGRPPQHTGTDGCGVPTFAFTLTQAATMFVRLGAERGAGRVLDAMAAHPFLVAGTGRLCTAVMTAAPSVTVKIGAEGLSCGVIRDRGLGFALKSRDGTQRARDVATVALLQMLEVLGEHLPDVLASHGDPAVTGGGEPVGAVRCLGSLQQA